MTAGTDREAERGAITDLDHFDRLLGPITPRASLRTALRAGSAAR